MSVDLVASERVWTLEDCQHWLAAVRIGDINQTAALLGEGIANYKELGRRIKQLEKLQEQVKRVIDNAMQDAGLSEYDCSAGNAAYRAGYLRISYDANALDILSNGDEALAKKLAVYRSETPVKGALVIS